MVAHNTSREPAYAGLSTNPSNTYCEYIGSCWAKTVAESIRDSTIVVIFFIIIFIKNQEPRTKNQEPRAKTQDTRIKTRERRNKTAFSQSWLLCLAFLSIYSNKSNLFLFSIIEIDAVEISTIRQL